MFEALIDRIEREERLSVVAKKLKGKLEPLAGHGVVRDVLTGRWLGHPAHPAVVIAPLVGWFGGTLLDVVGGAGSSTAARRLIGAGTVAAMPAAMTGAADWLTTNSAEERVGTVHAALADGATVMYATSWLLRARRHDRAAVAAGLIGASLAGATAFVGGHLSFRRGVGVTTVAFQSGPEGWAPLHLDDEPSAERPVRATAHGVVYAVVAASSASNGVIRAPHVMESRCSHRGGPLHGGSVIDGCVECPWHGARFDLDTGEVRRGPAASPQPVYEVEVRGDETLIRREELGGLRSNSTS